MPRLTAATAPNSSEITEVWAASRTPIPRNINGVNKIRIGWKQMAAIPIVTMVDTKTKTKNKLKINPMDN